MKRRFSFDLPKLNIFQSGSPKDSQPTATAVTVKAPPPPKAMPAVEPKPPSVRPPLPTLVEAELRAACTYVVNTYKPSHLYGKQQLDYATIKDAAQGRSDFHALARKSSGTAEFDYDAMWNTKQPEAAGGRRTSAQLRVDELMGGRMGAALPAEPAERSSPISGAVSAAEEPSAFELEAGEPSKALPRADSMGVEEALETETADDSFVTSEEIPPTAVASAGDKRTSSQAMTSSSESEVSPDDENAKQPKVEETVPATVSEAPVAEIIEAAKVVPARKPVGAASVKSQEIAEPAQPLVENHDDEVSARQSRSVSQGPVEEQAAIESQGTIARVRGLFRNPASATSERTSRSRSKSETKSRASSRSRSMSRFRKDNTRPSTAVSPNQKPSFDSKSAASRTISNESSGALASSSTSPKSHFSMDESNIVPPVPSLPNWKSKISILRKPLGSAPKTEAPKPAQSENTVQQLPLRTRSPRTIRRVVSGQMLSTLFSSQSELPSPKEENVLSSEQSRQRSNTTGPTFHSNPCIKPLNTDWRKDDGSTRPDLVSNAITPDESDDDLTMEEYIQKHSSPYYEAPGLDPRASSPTIVDDSVPTALEQEHEKASGWKFWQGKKDDQERQQRRDRRKRPAWMNDVIHSKDRSALVLLDDAFDESP